MAALSCLRRPTFALRTPRHATDAACHGSHNGLTPGSVALHVLSARAIAQTPTTRPALPTTWGSSHSLRFHVLLHGNEFQIGGLGRFVKVVDDALAIRRISHGNLVGIDSPMERQIMNTIFLLAVIAAIAVVIVKIKSPNRPGDEAWPFYAKEVLSQPEQLLYFRLVQALPDHMVLAQVQLSRFLRVKKGNNHQAWLNRINRMSADFVVCNKDSSIVAIIELDDDTHKKGDRRAADEEKDKALASAGTHVVRWHTKTIPDIASIPAAFMPNRSVNMDVTKVLSRQA